MTKFIYTAKTDPQNTLQGEIDAESEQEAIDKVHQMGYYPIVVSALHDIGSESGFFGTKKVSKKELLLLTHQLARLLESGVNIIKSLSIVASQASNKYFRAVINDVISKVKEGRPLSESFAQYPQIFPSLYTATLHAGEASGNIDKVLKHLARYLEKEESFRSSVRQSLTYPIFVSIVGALSVVVLVGFVIPRLVGMFQDMGQALPLPTTILINISWVLRHYWLFIVAFVFLAAFLLRRFYHSNQGKIYFDALVLKLPVMGEIILKSEINRLMHTLSLLVSSGIPITSALEVTVTIIDNELIKSEIKKFKEQITAGLSLSKCMQESKLFPIFVTNIIAVGEEGGNLETSLMSIAEEYQGDVDRVLKTFTSLLEPIVILVIGLVVGFIVMAMLLPIFQINLIAR